MNNGKRNHWMECRSHLRSECCRSCTRPPATSDLGSPTRKWTDTHFCRGRFCWRPPPLPRAVYCRRWPWAL